MDRYMERYCEGHERWEGMMAWAIERSTADDKADFLGRWLEGHPDYPAEYKKLAKRSAFPTFFCSECGGSVQLTKYGTTALGKKWVPIYFCYECRAKARY